MRTTREIRIGRLKLGGGNPIAVQSMCATRTQDLEATRRQIHILEKAGASKSHSFHWGNTKALVKTGVDKE